MFLVFFALLLLVELRSVTTHTGRAPLQNACLRWLDTHRKFLRENIFSFLPLSHSLSCFGCCFGWLVRPSFKSQKRSDRSFVWIRCVFAPRKVSLEGLHEVCAITCNALPSLLPPFTPLEQPNMCSTHSRIGVMGQP